jgi:hypothetical protein
MFPLKVQYHCVKSKNHSILGIISAKVNLDDKLGIFEYDPSVSAPDLIKDYVDEMGFEASLKHPGGVEENSSAGKALTGSFK